MSGEGQQIHSDAVVMVRIAILLLQLITAVFFFIRAKLNLMTCIAFLGFAVTSCFFFFLGPFPSCKPIILNTSHLPETNEQYVAPVLISSSTLDHIERDRSSPSMYGTPNISENVIRISPEIGSSNA